MTSISLLFTARRQTSMSIPAGRTPLHIACMAVYACLHHNCTLLLFGTLVILQGKAEVVSQLLELKVHARMDQEGRLQHSRRRSRPPLIRGCTPRPWRTWSTAAESRRCDWPSITGSPRMSCGWVGVKSCGWARPLVAIPVSPTYSPHPHAHATHQSQERSRGSVGAPSTGDKLAGTTRSSRRWSKA